MSDFSRTPWTVDGLTVRCGDQTAVHVIHQAGSSWSQAYANANLIAEVPALYALVCALGTELYKKIDGMPIEDTRDALALISEGMAATARASGYTAFGEPALDK